MSSPHRFVVRRQEWAPADATGIRRLLPEKWTRVGEFRTSEEAHQKYAELTAEARRTLNPFYLGGPSIFYQTSFPPHALHDFLLDRDITPPANSTSSNPNYAFWWVKNNRTFTDEQRAGVWAACDKIKLFDVTEEDDREAAHVVVVETVVPWPGAGMRHWRVCTDGGVIRTAHRTVREANRAAKEFADRIRKRIDPEEYPEGDPLVRFTGIVAVPASNSPDDGTTWLVVRQSYGDHMGGYRTDHEEDEFNAGARTPLAAFGNNLDAEDHNEQLCLRGRRTVNPFALVWRDGEVDAIPLFDQRELAFQDLPNGLTFDDAIDIVRRLPTHVPAPSDNIANKWIAWYDRVVQWSPEYIDVIWGTFADFRLFEVIEVPFG